MSSRNIWSALVLMLFATTAFAQTVSPVVQPVTGGSVSGANLHLHFTVGEPLNSTFSGGGRELSIGFEQPEMELKVDSAISNLYCTGDSIRIYYTALGIYGPGNLFTVQLSDAVGSFAAPVNLASDTGKSSGSIGAVIPTAMTGGTNYKVRVVSSYPVLNGGSKTITIHSPKGAVTPSDTTVWTGQQITLTGSGGLSYYWPSLGITTPTAIVEVDDDTDVFTTIITDTVGCINTVTIAAFSNDTLTLTVSGNPSTLEPGDSTIIIATANIPGTTITWSRDNLINIEGQSFGSGGNVRLLLTNNTNSVQFVNFTFNAVFGSYKAMTARGGESDLP